MNFKLNQLKDENKRLIDINNKNSKALKDQNVKFYLIKKKDYRLHSKYMMTYMSKVGLKEENKKLQ